jgi:hypothetical protein
MTLALNPPQSEEFEAMATMAVGLDARSPPGMTEASESDTESATTLLETSETRDSMCCKVSSYGRMASVACCALCSLALDTSFMAEVIFSVLLTDPIRPFISFNVGILKQLKRHVL